MRGSNADMLHSPSAAVVKADAQCTAFDYEQNHQMGNHRHEWLRSTLNSDDTISCKLGQRKLGRFEVRSCFSTNLCLPLWTYAYHSEPNLCLPSATGVWSTKDWPFDKCMPWKHQNKIGCRTLQASTKCPRKENACSLLLRTYLGSLFICVLHAICF